MDFRFKRQVPIGPIALGMDSITVATEQTSSTFDLSGADELALFVVLTWTAATRVDIALDLTHETGAAPTDWHIEQTAAVAGGTVTYSDLSAQKAVAASKKFTVRFKDLNARQGRIRVIGQGATTDTVKITAIRCF